MTEKTKVLLKNYHTHQKCSRSAVFWPLFGTMKCRVSGAFGASPSGPIGELTGPPLTLYNVCAVPWGVFSTVGCSVPWGIS